MTTYQPNLDAAQRAVDAARERTITALIQAWQNVQAAPDMNAVHAALTDLLHSTTNLIYASTVKTIDYASAIQDRRSLAQQDTIKALGDRQARHADWLTQHEQRLAALTQEITRLRALIEQGDTP